MEVDRCLRLGSSGRQIINVHFRHDCFYFIFSHCTNRKKLHFSDFRPSYFCPGWEQCIKNHDTQQNTHGIRILFPIEVTSMYLNWMPKGHFKDDSGTIVQKSRTFMEMIRFKIRKENF